MSIASVEAADRYKSIRKDLRGPPCVYLVQCGETGPIKIGSTHKAIIQDRVSTLQIGNHEQLHLRAWMATEPIHEQVLHAMFEDHHIRGEWYHPHEDILAIVDAMNQADVTELRIMLHRMTQAYGIEKLAEMRPDYNIENMTKNGARKAGRYAAAKRRARKPKEREFPPEPNEHRYIT